MLVCGIVRATVVCGKMYLFIWCTLVITFSLFDSSWILWPFCAQFEHMKSESIYAPLNWIKSQIHFFFQINNKFAHPIFFALDHVKHTSTSSTAIKQNTIIYHRSQLRPLSIIYPAHNIPHISYRRRTLNFAPPKWAENCSSNCLPHDKRRAEMISYSMCVSVRQPPYVRCARIYMLWEAVSTLLCCVICIRRSVYKV